MTRRNGPVPNVLAWLAVVATAIALGGCSTDISNQARYQRLIGTSVALNREQALWKKEGTYHAEGASYLIVNPDATPEKATYVRDLRAGTHVMIVAVRRRDALDGTSEEYAIVRLTLPVEQPDPFMAELHMGPTPAGVRDFPW
jgi:hypothetical protein